MTEVSLSDVVGPGPQGPRRRTERAAAKRRKRRHRRTWVSVLLVLAVVAGGGFGAWHFGLRPLLASWNEPDDFAGPGTGSVTVRIPSGASVSAIGGVLKDAGVVKTGKAFVAALEADSQAGTLQPGTYRLRREMSSTGALEALFDPASRLLSRVTIPEGRRLSQILDALAKGTSIPRADWTKAAKDAEGIGLPPAARGNAEGYLFPATYDIQPDDSATAVLARMVERGREAVTEAGVPEAREHDVMVLASIVQVEAGSKADMGKVARVFANRVAGRGTSQRRLESDATVSFATNSFAITTTDQQRQSPSPYNTYRRPGLPPGPISSPGLDAIRAALDPEPGSWLWFVTVNPDTGETRFAETEAQRVADTKLFQAWLRAHPQG